jgi:two-component system osmolarity sensor histidine kinase EnvZ
MKKAHFCEIVLRFKVPLEAIVKRDAFKRCLANLVQNACQSASRIRISAVKNRTYLEIVIEDDGPGIAPDQRENVFRPFYRLDEARNQDAGGTGLGLAIARDIARNHGGDITLGDSDLGGLKATVHIPL